jgi:ubiquitin C-terminal hydrolase
MDEEIQDYTCEKCKHKSNKHRVQQIVYAPDVLLLQIKRFNHNGNKDNFKVNYGQTLDLSRHAANKTSKTSLLYQLKSVIQHWGGAGAGHYTSTVRIPENLWTEFDDGTCSDVNVGHALDPTKMASGFTPYLLFYERIADS